MSDIDCYHCGETITSGHIVVNGCTYCDAICAAGAGAAPIPPDDRAEHDPDAALSARVAELRAWARARIEECQRHEGKYPVGSLAEIEATQERRTLRAVLRILDRGTP